MKKIISILILGLITFTASSQVLSFRTTSYTSKTKNYYGWTDWSPTQSSNMILTINLDSDVIKIYSPTTQIYCITSYDGSYVDNDGDVVIRFSFIDQDGDYGHMRLMQRTSGKSEIYIDFSNIIWVYSVVRID